MKKLLVFPLALLLIACGNEEAATGENQKEASAPPAAENKEVQRGLELVATNDCFGCHKIEETLTGPSYREVAQRYADSSGAVVDTLASRIIKGSVGHWGEMQMTPHPALSEDEAKAMVVYILSLKQQ